jgi:hypothetical protein
LDELVVLPFLKCLETLTSYGADPHAKVQKLLRFRELDEEKRKLALVKNAQEAAEVKV